MEPSFLGKKALGLTLASALLLASSWYFHLSFLMFFAWVPLLLLEADYARVKHLARQKLKFTGLVYLCFLLWNILVTWWVTYASFGGACMAFICNSLLMTMVFVSYSSIKQQLGKFWAMFTLIPLWLAWEHAHTLWDLTWTWLTLGNVFAFQHKWIQWYEYTGTSGGSAWVLLVNLLLFRSISTYGFSLSSVKKGWPAFALMVVPILLSYLILNTRTPATTKPYNVVVAQPNLDPYNVKFEMDFQSQFLKMLKLVKPTLTKETNYLILPETFITDNLNEADLAQHEVIRWFKDSLLVPFPKLHIITGCNTYRFYTDPDEISATARKDETSGLYYDQFNTALQISTSAIAIYHKSKLVPGVERMPFPWLLKPLESLAINMGGTMGSLGTQPYRSVFRHSDGNAVAAPVICYESVYADYLTQYIRAGANFIAIITNDGWWEDTPGYKQHLNYARLRAIENRVPIARSANTGISCFITPDGTIQQATGWWKEAVISASLPIGTERTFFNRFGDLLSYFSVGLTLVFWSWSRWLKWKNRTPKTSKSL